MKRYQQIRIKLILLAAILLLLAAMQPVYSQHVVCFECDKVITGDYLEVEKQPYHFHCFLCYACKEPLDGGYVKHNGKFYDSECYQKLIAPRCEYCARPLEGMYVTKEDKFYHESCYLENIAQKCVISGEPIVGAYLENFWGQKILSKYKKHLLTCETCGRFQKPGHGRQFSDGRIQCETCGENEVKSQVRARFLVQKAKDLLENKGIHIETPLDEITVALLDRDQLELIMHDSGDQYGLHYVQTESQNGSVIREETTIYFLTHLPEDLFLAVAGHELFHVWQHENDADGGSPRWREGSANVAMRLVLDELNSKLADYHIYNLNETDDPTYGEGYRTALKHYLNNGTRGFLAKVIQEGRKTRR